jgi:hypothetical protein
MSGHEHGRTKKEEGAALLSALMVMLLMAGVTAGFTALVITDTRVRVMDSTRTQSFYAVHAGLEQLTARLGDLFSTNVAPSAAQINALMADPPDVGVIWERPDGTNGYRITFPVDADGNAEATVMTVQNGPFQGLVGLATNYEMEVTGRLDRVADGGETALTRRLQTVAIPVFQFGIFSQNDLSFFPGPTFNFGGRVHSNENIFLATRAADPGLTLADRVTAVGEIVRRRLSNGMSTETEGYTGVVRAITAPNTFRNLAMGEGSVVDGIGSAVNEPAWTNLSTNFYNSNVMNGRTGARRLDLPIAMFSNDGPIALIRRPVVNENTTNLNLFNERFYTLASLRILLSDNAADITNLPGVVGTPVELGSLLDTSWYTVSANANTPRPRIAQTSTSTGSVVTTAGLPLIGGYILIEKQTTAGTWVDVTREILSLGFNSPQLHSANTGAMTYAAAAGAIACPDLTPNAIVRLQREWDAANAAGCRALADAMANTDTAARRYTPLSLYDPREGLVRDTAPTSMRLGGIMHYVELDARNLARWFRGQIPAANCPLGCSGANALFVNGYTVYFSDRRGNRNAANAETGEYGFEDFVNPASSTGAPNNTLDVGEDVNGNNVLDIYGKTARAPYGITWGQLGGHLTSTKTPLDEVGTTNPIERARRNPQIFFRRALKLTRGADLVTAAPGLQGLTIASENPVYLQGNWNSTGGNFNGAHIATAVLADSVTLLSNNWNDRASFTSPHGIGGRNATTTWYRIAVIAGKGLSFPRPSAGSPAGDYGTDGGAHNFLRFLEDWANQTLNYRGSIASLFVSRQAVGTYKCCNTVYGAPTRGYNFDTEFLTPALLPPRTPMFRDVNITGFAQLTRP